MPWSVGPLQEWRHRAQNAVAPGPVDTPMTQGETFETSGFPMQRMASAEEIAGPLVFLVSPAARYINGSVLDINGALHFS